MFFMVLDLVTENVACERRVFSLSAKIRQKCRHKKMQIVDFQRLAHFKRDPRTDIPAATINVKIRSFCVSIMYDF